MTVASQYNNDLLPDLDKLNEKLQNVTASSDVHIDRIKYFESMYNRFLQSFKFIAASVICLRLLKFCKTVEKKLKASNLR